MEGLGFSDDATYAQHLDRLTLYTNSWLDTEPRRDITNLESFGGKTYDYVMCSEVLEHVDRPIELAFQTLFDILKPGGTLLFSVPMSNRDTVEHFPQLDSWHLTKRYKKWGLSGVLPDGTAHIRSDLTFHGGPGSTLEMRVFGREAVTRHLEIAGFVEIVEHRDDVPEFGIFWDRLPDRIELSGGTIEGLSAGIWTARRPATLDPTV